MFIGAISSGGILSNDFPVVVTAQWSCRISSVNSWARTMPVWGCFHGDVSTVDEIQATFIDGLLARSLFENTE